MKKDIKKFIRSNWSLTEKCLLLADVLLFGVLIGWLTSPFKGGFKLFSNNTLDIGTNEWDIDNFGDEFEEEEEV